MSAIRKVHNQLVSDANDYGDNLSLRMDKFNPEIDFSDNENSHEQKDKLLGMLSAFEISQSNFECYKYAFENWKKVIENQNNSLCFDIVNLTKLFLGTGNASVHEFGLSLNKIWGLPYISGTVLKGFVSSYLARFGGNEWAKNIKNGKKSENQVQLFGGEIQDSKDKFSYIGSVIFHDVWIYPITGKIFVPDIINAHNLKYFRKERMPDGTEEPIPVKLSVLRPELKFFAALQGDKKELEFIKSVLAKAFLDEGIGGKKTAGYGRFEILKTENEKGNEILSADIEKLCSLYDEEKNTGSLKKFFAKAAESKPLDLRLKKIYQKLSPLRLVLLEIDSGKINDLSTLNKIYKSLKNDLKNFKKENAFCLEDRIKILDFAKSKFSLKNEEISDNPFLSTLLWTWDEFGLKNDNIADIAENLDNKRWLPDLHELRKKIESMPENENRDLALLYLEDFMENN